MEFENKYCIPLSAKKETVENSFLFWAYEKRELPIDIQKTAKLLEVTSFYVSMRKFYNIKYKADWEAMSIWEHKEEYTEYKTKTVYLNDSGQECNTPSEAMRKTSHTPIEKSFIPQAMQKVEPITKHKTVIDRTQMTSGTVEQEGQVQYVVNFDGTNNELNSWIESIGKYSLSKCIEYVENDNDNVLEPQYNADDDFRATKYSLQQSSEPLCKKQVPGNRYTNFRITNFDCTYDSDIILIPIYKVKYTYQNKEYAYLVAGNNLNDTFSVNHPVDNEYLMHETQLTNNINQKSKSISLLSKLTKVVFPILMLISTIMLMIAGVGAVLLISSIIGDIVCFVLLKNRSKEIDAAKENLNIMQNRRDEIRDNYNRNGLNNSEIENKNIY